MKTLNSTTGNKEVGRTAGGRTMMAMHRSGIGWVLGAAALVAFAAGCAQDIGEINRVQNNLVKKADLLYNQDGTRKEWYFRTTVVEAPYASAFAFVGNQGRLERGVFDVQEKNLYFYRSYTWTEGEYNDNPRKDVDMPLLNKDGTEYKLNGKAVWMDKNAPLLVYGIDKHADVIWEYNPNTGERTNVKSENDSDRMWFERDYMRVSWGVNQVMNLSNADQWKNYPNGSDFVDIYRDQSAAPDVEPRLTPEIGYMDFLIDEVVGVATEDSPDYGTIPLCWYYPWYSGGIYECVSEKIRVRGAFVQVDAKAEAAYPQQAYDDHDLARFGYYRAERLVWDHDYGTTYSGMSRNAFTFDIFERDDKGAKVGVKPIVYYINEDYPDDLVEEAVQVGVQWSRAFDATVKAVLGKDPSSFKAKVKGADGKVAEVAVTHMFVVCENNTVTAKRRTDAGLPVASVDPICQLTEEPRRNGDFRWSFLHAVVPPTTTPLYGFGPPTNDPISGRTVSAVAYNYVAAMREGAMRAMRRIELLSGVKSFRELANADYSEQEMRAMRLRESTYWRTGYTEADVQKLATSLGTSAAATALTAQPLQKTDENFSQARMAILDRNPELASMFINDDVKMIFKDPLLGDKNPVTAADVGRYAMSRWANTTGMKSFRNYLVNATRAGWDLAAFYDGALIGRSEYYKKLYDDAVCKGLQNESGIDFTAEDLGEGCTIASLVEKLRVKFAYANGASPYTFEVYSIPTPLESLTHDNALAATQAAMNRILAEKRTAFLEKLYKEIFFGVAIHEVGHNLGLRHNFEASTDAINFPKQYWDLKVVKNGDKFEPVSLWGENANQVRGLKPDGTPVETWTDADGNVMTFPMREYQYSSVMDYYAKFNMPWHGIGLYDIAAIKYAYGDVVEVFETNPDLSSVQAYLDANPALEDPANVPDIKVRGEGLQAALRRVHPTQYPNLWGDVDAMYKRVDMPKADVIGKHCSGDADCGGKVCKAFSDGMRCSVTNEMVPYRFGGDEMAEWDPWVSTFDEGVDPFEIVNNLVSYYKNYWVMAGYWHGDPNFWPSMYDGWVRMFFGSMRRHYQWWVLNYNTYNHNDYWKKHFGKRWEEDINGGLPGAVASHLSFNTLAGVFGEPASDIYGYNSLTKRFEPYDQVNQAKFSNLVFFLEEDGARPIYANWNYDGYLPVVISAGSIYDRIAAFEALSDPETDFMAVDVNADSRKYLINYATMFRDQVNRLFGGLVANNSEKYGWCVLLADFNNADMCGANTRNQVKALSVAPREFATMDLSTTECASYYCGRVDCATQTLLEWAKADLSSGNAVCPDGMFPLQGQPVEPEPLYIFPTTRFRIPLLAAYYGFALLGNNYDRSFMNETRIWLKGSKYAVELPDAVKADPDNLLATCEDRFSGRIFQAYRLPGDGYYPAYDLVKQCEKLFSCYDETANDSLPKDLQDLCTAYASSSKQVKDLTLDDLRAAWQFHPLQFLLGKLELVRSMHQTYDYAVEE